MASELGGTETARATLRPLSPADLAAAHALTASFGWPHRLEDWQMMLGLGSGLAAECAGRLVGTAMRWTYGPDWAAMGMVGVDGAMQGAGLGRFLAEAALAGLDGRAVLLHATEVAVPLYRSLGFVACGTIRQYQGAVFGSGLVPLAPGERLRPIGRSDPASLARCDAEATGMDRAALLNAILESGTGVVLDRAGEMTGFALLRRFGRGLVVGPVIAPDAARAQALIAHFLGSRPGQFVRIDVPEESGLCPWLSRLGLVDAGPGTRMVRGAGPAPSGPGRVFALASHAFG